jgi:hypothetical protein
LNPKKSSSECRKQREREMQTHIFVDFQHMIYDHLLHHVLKSLLLGKRKTFFWQSETLSLWDRKGAKFFAAERRSCQQRCFKKTKIGL